MELLLHQWGDWPELYRNTDKTEATEIVIIDSQMNYRGKLDTYHYRSGPEYVQRQEESKKIKEIINAPSGPVPWSAASRKGSAAAGFLSELVSWWTSGLVGVNVRVYQDSSPGFRMVGRPNKRKAL